MTQEAMSRGKAILLALLAVLGIGGGIWGWNQVTVNDWVTAAQEADPRNASFQIQGRYRYYVLPGTLVLDLTRVQAGEAAPVDLWRGLLQIAEEAATEERRFDRVILARNREPVFLMKGEDFYQIGKERSLGQNPIYQVRTLPEKLYHPDGEGAFGRWTGGMLGVLSEQMEDVSEASKAWVLGQTPTGKR